jgi:hypothetical protein
MRRAASILLLCLFVTAAACGDDGDPASDGLPRKTLPPPTDQPYVSVAVDNHFHDIHVEDDITIAFGQGFIVKNQGGNLHNVTIPEIDFSKDIRPGEQVEFLGETLDPGTYNVVCHFHDSEGMVGRFTVAD